MTNTMKRKSVKRQHFLARLYLRNFADPMHGKKLCVYEFRKQKWDCERTPEGIGYRLHNCSFIDNDGKKNDELDQFITKEIEPPAIRGIKSLADGRDLSDQDKRPVARFIAYTQARLPGNMDAVLKQHVAEQNLADRWLDEICARKWCEQLNLPYTPETIYDYLKPTLIKAMPVWAEAKAKDLLTWDWHKITTDRDRPFITSDRLLFGQKDDDSGVVSCPISPQVTLLMTRNGDLNPNRDMAEQVRDINKRTMANAKDFVIGWKPDFPGADLLPTICQRLETASSE